ncbi:hypothetical protein V8F06_001454 [Rhypophila decipiens]
MWCLLFVLCHPLIPYIIISWLLHVSVLLPRAVSGAGSRCGGVWMDLWIACLMCLCPGLNEEYGIWKRPCSRSCVPFVSWALWIGGFLLNKRARFLVEAHVFDCSWFFLSVDLNSPNKVSPFICFCLFFWSLF